jgi:hypothetical protein
MGVRVTSVESGTRVIRIAGDPDREVVALIDHVDHAVAQCDVEGDFRVGIDERSLQGRQE